MPDDQQGESILKKYGFNPPGVGGEASLASPTPVAVPPEETGGILQKYGFKPPAPTQEVKPPVAPAQPPQADLPRAGTVTEPSVKAAPAPLPKPAGETSVPKEPEVVPGGFGGEVKRSSALPEALAPTRQPEEPSLLSEVGTGAKLGLVDLAQRAARSIDPSIGMGGMEVPPPEERAKAGGDRLLKELFPQGVPKPAGMAGEVVRGLSESWPALLALGALAPVGSIPAFAAWGLTEEKPVEGAVKGAVLGGTLAGLGKVTAPIVNPVARWLTKIAGGAAIGGGATALQGGGPEEISRDALIFGLFETWGLARSGEWRSFLKDKGVPEADLKTLDEKKTDSPEFVGAMNEAAAKVVEKSMFDKTPQPEAPTPEAQKEAIFGGDVKDIIESKENRADAIQALVPKIGDQARAEQFYDLYQKGDAATALKEFPELASWATAGARPETIVSGETPPETSSEADSKAAAAADMVTSPAHAVNPAGRSNTTEPPPEAAPEPPRVPAPPPEPPSSAPAQAGGGGTVGLSAGPAGEGKPKVAPAESTTPAAPMGSPGSVAEDLAKGRPVTDMPGSDATWGKLSPQTKTLLDSKVEMYRALDTEGRKSFASAVPKEFVDYLEAKIQELPPAPTITPSPIVKPGAAGEVGGETKALREAVSGKDAAKLRSTLELDSLSYLLDMPKVEALAEISKLRDQWSVTDTPEAKIWLSRLKSTEQAINRYVKEPAPAPEAPAEVDPLQAAKDFRNKFGSRQGAPDVGIERDDYGGENEDRRKILKEFGKFDSRADILKNFDASERKLLFPYTKRDAQSPDALLSEVKGIYPHLFGEFETDADLLRAIINGKLKPTDYAKIEEAHNAAIEREAAENELNAAAVAQVEADVAREIAAERDAIQNEPGPGEPADTFWDAAESAFGLSPREKPASRLTPAISEEIGKNKGRRLDDPDKVIQWAAPKQATKTTQRAVQYKDYNVFLGEIHPKDVTPDISLTDKAQANWREKKNELGQADLRGLSEPDVISILSAAKRGEASLGENRWGDLSSYRIKTGRELPEALVLKGREKPASKLNARLDELAAEYPDIDRDKAATVLRSLPNADNGQIANMSADPEMFSRVARGNLAATEKEQLLKKASDAGAQGELPGMGGEGRLFKAGEEAAFARGLTTEQIRQNMTGSKDTLAEIAPGSFDGTKYSRGWQITRENGQMVLMFESRDGSLAIGPGETLGADYSALGITSLEGNRIAASFKPVSFGSVYEFAKPAGLREGLHENWHEVEHWLLRNKERQSVIRDLLDRKKLGSLLTDKEFASLKENPNNEELRCEAYSRWDGKKLPNTVFEKIQKFFADIYKAITGYESGEDVFAAARSGELFAREPVERGRSVALAPEKYRVEDEEGGKWGMIGGLAGKLTGDTKAAQKEGKGLRDLFASWFWSSRTSEEAHETHREISGTSAGSQVEKTRMENIFNKYVDSTPLKGDNAQGIADTQEFLRAYQHGQEDQITHPVFKEFGREFRKEERREMEIMTILGNAPKELPNYIDQLWEQNETREQIKGELMSQLSSGRSLKPNEYYKLMRKIIDIPTGMAERLIPKYDSLAEMALAGRTTRENAIASQKQINYVTEKGYAKVVRSLDDGKFTVTDADGKEQTFKNPNDARRFVIDNPGSSEPRFEPAVPQGWKIYPGGFGEVWAKVKRRGGAMIPERADEEVLPMGGGPERSGYEEVPGVNAWTRVGYRVGPEEVVRQFEDYLGRGLSGNTAFEKYQGFLHAFRTAQMAGSFFHAFAETINSTAVRAGEGMSDIGGLFTGDWRRAAGGLLTVAKSPAGIFQDINLGRAVVKELLQHGMGLPGETTKNELLNLGRAIVGGGQRIPAETEITKILSRGFKEAWKMKGTNFGKAGFEFLRGLASPVMELIVPFAKIGSNVFKYQAELRRWERTHPNETPTMDNLHDLAYESRNTGDAIFGQIAKDNVGMNATLRSLMTGVLQFPTWTFGTVELGARSVIGAKDLMGKVSDMMRGKEIRQLAIKDRMALQYAAGLIFTVGMTGALMHWTMTGKKPEEMADFFFPKTGEVNANGSEERLQLPSYFKDAMGVTHHPFQTIAAKLASPIHVLSDLIQNKDYWGNQVYDPHDWAGQRGIDVMKYLAKTGAPFSLQSYEQGAKQTPGRLGMSLLGVRPVPREYSNTPAQNVIDEYNQMMRASITTKESAEKKTLKSDLMKMARDQDESGFQEAAGQAVSEGKITRQQVKEIATESQAPPSMSRFTKLPLEWATRAFEAGSDYEKEQWKPYYLKKVMAEKPENLIKNRESVESALREMGMDEAADAVANLVMPEEPLGGIDLTGLGLQKEAPEMGGMEEVDAAIAQALEQNLKGKEKRVSMRLPSTREKKKKPYEVLGL